MNFTPSIDPHHFHNSRVSIGSFDGVHLGHQALIKRLVAKAQAEKSSAVVITFWPHPSTFFKRAPQAYALTSPEERRELICDLSVDEVLTMTFDQSLADLSARQFMQFLKDTVDVKTLVAGPNFALGKGREGTIENLKLLGQEMNFEVEVVDALTGSQGMISSSLVRADLADHRVKDAWQKLGRPYRLTGKVVHGEHRGTGLGVPTANLEYLPERLIPANGVYATRAIVNGKEYASVTNIGVRPTFENPLPVPRIEPHLLDMQEQLYQQTLSLEFIDFLRPEMKFSNSQELVAQIQKDIAHTREIFTH